MLEYRRDSQENDIVIVILTGRLIFCVKQSVWLQYCTIHESYACKGAHMRYSQLRNLAMNDTGFAFDPSTGYSYQFSPLGVEIVNHLLGGGTRDSIIERILADYDVSSDIATQDFDFFLLQLSNLGLMEAEDALSSASGK